MLLYTVFLKTMEEPFCCLLIKQKFTWLQQFYLHVATAKDERQSRKWASSQQEAQRSMFGCVSVKCHEMVLNILISNSLHLKTLFNLRNLICNVCPRCCLKNTEWFNPQPVYGSFYSSVVPWRRPVTARFFGGEFLDEQETGACGVFGRTCEGEQKSWKKTISHTPKKRLFSIKEKNPNSKHNVLSDNHFDKRNLWSTPKHKGSH